VPSEQETHYVKSGDAHIAYQVVGDAPVDLIIVRGYISHLDVAWEPPALAAFYRQLASFCRLILFDKRGTGLSDRVPEIACPRSSSGWTTCAP
jgi:pimeloyl-ACP methyl ester carboxylesterase